MATASANQEYYTHLFSTSPSLAGMQPLDSDLTAIAALVTTPFGRALLTLIDAAALRATAGLGTLATQNGTFSGTSSGTNTGDIEISFQDEGAWLQTNPTSVNFTGAGVTASALFGVVTVNIPGGGGGGGGGLVAAQVAARVVYGM